MTLLPDVVDAAGGVERAHGRLHEAMALVQAAYGRAHAQFGEMPDGTHLADPSIEDAWYTIEELLVWARTMDDRLRRRAAINGYPDQGLIPAMVDGARRDDVVAARSRLLNAGVAEARFLSGLNLHMQSIHAGSKSGRVRPEGIVLPFPDRVTRPIDHRSQLMYSDGRDAVSFADGLMAGLEQFMDTIIDVFETHLPERFKTTPVHSPQPLRPTAKTAGPTAAPSGVLPSLAQGAGAGGLGVGLAAPGNAHR